MPKSDGVAGGGGGAQIIQVLSAEHNKIQSLRMKRVYDVL